MQSSRNLLLHYDYSMPSFFSYQIRDLLFLLQVRVPFPCFLTVTLTCEYCSFLTRFFFLEDWTNVHLYSAFSFFSR
jgi:hypothetical protein